MREKNNKELNSVYVVNEKYQIVYIDDAFKEKYPHFQDNALCYELLSHECQPCLDCPLKQLEENDTSIFHFLRYNKNDQVWNNYTILKLKWPNEGDCILVAVHPINDENRKVFLNINQNQHYDELLELDLNTKRYHYLYVNHDEIDLPEEGTIESLINNFSLKYVYPDDTLNFKAFFDINTLAYRTENMGHVVEDFRVLRSDSEYHYFSLYLQPVEKSKDNICYLCYAVNVDDRYHGNKMHFDNNYAAQVDTLTYLYNQDTFNKLVKERLQNDKKTSYGMISIDIEHFKLFNEWYGTEEGDRLLKYVANCIQNYMSGKDGYASRIGNDDFICFLPYKYCHKENVENELVNWIQNYNIEYKFLPAAGIYQISDRKLPVTLMCDRTIMAANSVKGNFLNRVSVYKETMKLKLENEQEILFGVKKGLENNEFEIYFQPQCSARTRKIIGAEVLVRWNHPTQGLLMPNSFIPILESSGFIYKLDYYVWEKTCEYIHQRMMNHEIIVPLSVNVSRLDIYQYNLVKVFNDLCKKYQVPKKYLEIEITESAYSENFVQLVETISQLRGSGFRILMDDFGSGYSALNMLKDIEVDTLKLDMKFLDMDETSLNKGLSVLESSILMAKWLKMGLIAEGVETEEQVKHLLNMNCEFMQGFYFYRPMSAKYFDELLVNHELVDTRDVMVDNLPVLQVEDLFHKDVTSESMLNNILGGIAIYEVDENNNIVIKTVNDGYYNITGCNSVDLKQKCSVIINQVHKDDQALVLDIFNRAEKAGHLGASGTFRRYRLSGEMMWMHLNAFFLHKEHNKRVFYGAVSDYTKQMQREREIQIVLDTVPGNIVEYIITEDGLTSRVLNYGLDFMYRYTKKEFEEIVHNGKGIELILEFDRKRIKQFFLNYEEWGDYTNINYPCVSKDGEVFMMNEYITYYGEEDNKKIYCAYCRPHKKVI
ncbi:EAL domain-containing protein [Longibaculum muris]|mgnify:FL=1|uniref:PAS domain S-box-containing protein/diguanylate cyclase (GGDEF)-like protein n=2 Tax=Longibaculum muris TaxID=1796628 RepID=A0A4R3YV31_9FIRM|nr:EAL domain-containing protein [Longibaculum muris]KXU51792.1 diguanylate cyclase domain protein [Candidatus Stoquefichus sp. KLE1796]MBS5369469.1 EAL domain-containing protein [Coprobacillus cateniformis]MCR1888846.1 EAL domain-containing protein [Longibaculum muris]TCV95063.1 PAS domain S-box-containing protein/diguanylate cyclase (GGDEF)-like protein [Longibaculum muris]